MSQWGKKVCLTWNKILSYWDKSFVHFVPIDKKFCLIWDKILSQWDKILSHWDEILSQWDKILSQWDEILSQWDKSGTKMWDVVDQKKGYFWKKFIKSENAILPWGTPWFAAAANNVLHCGRGLFFNRSDTSGIFGGGGGGSQFYCIII